MKKDTIISITLWLVLFAAPVNAQEPPKARPSFREVVIEMPYMFVALASTMWFIKHIK